jgi:hypothetical protein
MPAVLRLKVMSEVSSMPKVASKRRRRVERDVALDAELQATAEEYLRGHHAVLLERLEKLPVGSAVCFSNAIDPDREVSETRTGQFLQELHARGCQMEDYPLFGLQIHQDGRHVYVAPLPVKRALAKVLEELKAEERLRALSLKFLASGKPARLQVEAWRLPEARAIPHWSEVYKKIDAVYETLSSFLPGFMSKEVFEEAVKAAHVTPRMQVAASRTFSSMWTNFTFAQRLRLESSIRMKRLHGDAAFKARGKVRKSLAMKAKWQDESFRQKKVLALRGNKIMQQLWQIESFRAMKRAWYDDPTTRAMMSANGTKVLAQLRQNPEYLAKIAQVHRERFKTLWGDKREQMLAIARAGKVAMADKLRDPAYHAQMVAHRNQPGRISELVEATREALQDRQYAHEGGKFPLDAVAKALDFTLSESPTAGLVEFSWNLRCGQETYAKVLLVKLAVARPEERQKVEKVLANPGAGPLSWRENVDVAMVKRLFQLKAGFSIPNLVVLNPNPTSEAAVRDALGLQSVDARKGAEAGRGISEEGVLALERNFAHLPAIRRAFVAAASSPSMQSVLDFCSRFEKTGGGSSSSSTGGGGGVNALDAVRVYNFREVLADGSSNCTLCLTNIKSAWTTHEKNRCHAMKEQIAKSDQAASCQMYKSWQLACKLCRSDKFSVCDWDAHVASTQHATAAHVGVVPMETTPPIDDMEFMEATQDPGKIRCRLCQKVVAVKTAPIHNKGEKHKQRAEAVRRQTKAM